MLEILLFIQKTCWTSYLIVFSLKKPAEAVKSFEVLYKMTSRTPVFATVWNSKENQTNNFDFSFGLCFFWLPCPVNGFWKLTCCLSNRQWCLLHIFYCVMYQWKFFVVQILKFFHVLQVNRNPSWKEVYLMINQIY